MPFLTGKGEEIMSEGHPQTPGEPEPSGLHTPLLISLLGSLRADPSRDVLLKGALLRGLGKLFAVGISALDD